MREELLTKVKEAIKEPIVGNYIFNADELEEIYHEAAVYLQSFSYSNKDRDSVIFVALVNLTKEWKSDEDTFLDFIYRKISSNHRFYQLIYSNLRSTILSLFESKTIYMIEWGKRFYATLCSHAFAPISSTESFFDMCWEIYCDDLDQQYEKTDSVYGLIVGSLKNKFKSVKNLDDDIKIGSHAYSMRAGMKGLAIHAPFILEQLISDTIGSLHSLFNDRPIDTNKYYKVLLINWWKRKQITFGVSKRAGDLRKESTVKTYSQIRARLILIDNVIKLLVPPIRLLDNFDIKPFLEIFKDDELIYKEEMHLHGSGIIMSTLQREYPLIGIDFKNNLIRVVVSHCDKTIYDSKKSLHREFILFKNSREITSSECIPGKYALYINDLNDLLRFPLGLEKISENVYYFEAIDGEIVQSSNRTVLFYYEQANRKLNFYARKKNDVIFKKDGLEYQVIDGELSIDVINSFDIGNIGIKYEGASFKLAEFPHYVVNSKTRYEITSLLNVCEPQKMIVFKYNDNSIVATINIIKFNNVSVTFDKTFYYGDDDIGVVTFKTDKYYGKDSFNIKNGNVSIPLQDGELLIKTPVIRWKIDDGEWNHGPSSKDIWFKNINKDSILYLDIPNNILCSVALSNGQELSEHGTKNSYNLGEIIQLLSRNSSVIPDSLRLFIKTETIDFLPLFDIVFVGSFMFNPLTVYQHDFKVLWNPIGFVGDSASTFIVKILEDDKLIETYDVTLSPKLINCIDFKEGKYIAKIFIKLGFKEKELYSSRFVFGNEKNVKFKNRIMFINTVITIDKALYRKQVRPIFIDKIEYLGSKDGFDYYSGYLFVVSKDGKRIYLDKMKDSNGVLSIINPIRIELKTERSCYIGYGLDLEDDGFEYDNEFSIDHYGRTVIGNYVDGKKTSPVDYFIFEIKKAI